jgi:diguanylate cyclase (GGDEF)-like protein/PAS domain S-box-containing protein
MHKSWSIRQLFNLVLAALLVPPALLLIYSIHQRYEDQIEDLHARSLALARASAEDAVSLVDNARYILDGLAKRALIRALDPDRCDPILRDLSQWYAGYANLSTIDRSGRVVCNTVSVQGQLLPNFSKREWFEKIFNSRSFLIGAPVVGETTHNWVVPLVQPLFDDSGNMIGVLSLTINTARLKPKVLWEQFPTGTEVSIIDSSGTFIARSATSEAQGWAGQRLSEAKLVAMMREQQSDAAISVRYRGENKLDYVISSVRVPGANWHVIVKIPTQSITAGALKNAIFNAIAVGLVLVVGIGIATLILRNIGRSIAHTIAATAKAHILGDSTARVAEIGPKEIITLARQFNLLLDAQQKAEERLDRQKRQLDAAIDNMSQGLLLFDAAERIVVYNQRYIEMYGLSSDVVRVGCTLRELLQRRVANGQLTRDPEQYRADLMAELAEGKTVSWIVETGDGRDISVINMPMPDGGWVVTHEDITERKLAERKLDQAQRFLTTIIENAPVPIVVKAPLTHKFVLVNREYERYAGKQRDDLIGKTVYDMFPPHQAELLAKLDVEATHSDGRPIKSELTLETPGNGPRITSETRLVVRDSDDKPQHLIVVIEDVTERRASDARIAHMAHHDLLTGLPNRALFLQKTEEAGARLRQRGETFTVFMLDLDRFKDVNDSLGHPAGDKLLGEVAQRLKALLSETDVLARLGGDEFAILQSGEAHQSGAAGRLAASILEILAESFNLDGATVVIGVSIGIAQAPVDGTDPSELMKKADLALYRQKSKGRNGYRFFDAEMTERADARLQLTGDLRNALLNSELEIHYQPVVDVRTREPCGVEALVRWRHPQRGNIPPAEFIPLAEENGLIVPIGDWILQKACADAALLPPHIKVAINLSPIQFKSGNLFRVILCALVESGLAPERLELEITESVLIESHVNILPVIRQLKNIGVSLVLDDFGTGYSSLSYLTMFPFDKIKIDKSFTQDIRRVECAAIISSVLALGRSLGIITTAEGVETEEQFELLRASGVNLVQGYLFGRPCPISQLELGQIRRGESTLSVA